METDFAKEDREELQRLLKLSFSAPPEQKDIDEIIAFVGRLITKAYDKGYDIGYEDLALDRRNEEGK